MSSSLETLMQLMAKLRAPDGCPWDRKQTHESLKPYLVEEAYEVLDAIDQGDPGRLREELGDVLLQIVFHTQIAGEHERFSMEDVMRSLSEKLIRRHPHVFGSPEQKGHAKTADDVKITWEQIKRDERERAGGGESALEGIPKTLPALLRAFQVQARAARVGFDWSELRPVLQKLEEELHELREALQASETDSGGAPSKDALQAELGDVLFTVVNLARHLSINPEEALRGTVNRFIDRFHYIERRAAGRRLEDMPLEEMDALWEEAKRAHSLESEQR